MHRVIGAAWIALAVVGAAVAAPSRTAELAGRAGDSVLAGWQADQVEVSDDGGHARLRFPAGAWWRPRWPSVSLLLAPGNSRGDWQTFDRLVLTVEGDPRYPVLLRTAVEDATGRRALQLFLVPARRTRELVLLLQDLAEQLDLGSVARLVVYMNQPSTDCQLRLHGVELQADALDLSQATLTGDPFGRGQVRVEAQAPRSVRWVVRVERSGGGTVAADTVWSAALAWTWSGGPPGEYRVTLLATDPGDGQASVHRDLGLVQVRRAGGPGLVLWVDLPTRQVMLHSRPSSEQQVLAWEALAAGSATPLVLQLARNEVESAQLVLLASDDSIRVRPSLDPPRLDRGGALDSLQADVLRVGYVRTRGGQPYRADGVGWWPDPLLSGRLMTAAPGECLALWLTFRSRVDTAPGIYRGALRLDRGEGRAGLVPIEVRVWPVTVPAHSTLRTAFTLNEDALGSAYPDGVPVALRQRYRAFVADHRLNVDNLYRKSPPVVGELVDLAAVGRLNAANLLEVSAADSDRLDDLAARLDPVVDHLRRVGLVGQAYVYGFDESESNEFAALERVFGFVKGRYPDVRTATTARDPSLGLATGLDRVVDIWAQQTSLLDPAAAAAARARGRQVWWYVCSSPTHPYANLMIEYPVIEARLLGWMSWHSEVSGLLYYAVNRWPRAERPMPPTGAARTAWNPASFGSTNGDGCLFYAGPDGPVTTARLENLRDGLEDFELLTLLGREEGRLLCEQVVRSPTDYSRNPEWFASVRQRLLEQLSGGAAGRRP